MIVSARLLLAVFALSVLGCADTSTQVADLEARVAQLEARLQTAEATSQRHEADIARHNQLEAALGAYDYETLLAFLADLAERIEVTEDGDLIFYGTNLRVQKALSSGAGANGKGNLILGFEEPQQLRCNGGTADGAVCEFGGDCPGGSCDELSGRDKSGSHNLILGANQTFPASGAIVTGSGNSAQANGVIILGGSGVVASTPGQVIVAP